MAYDPLMNSVYMTGSGGWLLANSFTQQSDGQWKMARHHGQIGIPVFPCRCGRKEPATPNGFADASIDRAQIDRWWRERPEYNLAFEPERAGWCIIDVDITSTVDGRANWKTLCTEHGGEVRTWTVRTPSGGRHFYFLGSLPPSTSRLGPGIDTRGRGSYVLVPPSRVDGVEYVVIDDRDMSPLPAWIPELLCRHRPDDWRDLEVSAAL